LILKHIFSAAPKETRWFLETALLLGESGKKFRSFENLDLDKVDIFFLVMPQPHVNWCAEISVEIAREVYKTCRGFGDFVVGMFTLHSEDGTCQPQNEMYVLSSNPKCFRI